jgi:hypothetical protein
VIARILAVRSLLGFELYLWRAHAPLPLQAPVAQLDRAFASQARGLTFPGGFGHHRSRGMHEGDRRASRGAGAGLPGARGGGVEGLGLGRSKSSRD